MVNTKREARIVAANKLLGVIYKNGFYLAKVDKDDYEYVDYEKVLFNDLNFSGFQRQFLIFLEQLNIMVLPNDDVRIENLPTYKVWKTRLSAMFFAVCWATAIESTVIFRK